MKELLLLPTSPMEVVHQQQLLQMVVIVSITQIVLRQGLSLQMYPMALLVVP